MSDVNSDSLDLDDDNRLPWLESAEDYDSEDEYSPLRVALFIGLGIALLAAIVGGIYWMQNRDGGGLSGDGTLIAAQEGDYKVRPDDPQARQFEGEGDASFAASEGQETPGKLGTAPPVEAPIKKAAPTAPSAPGSAMIQLGAFSSTGQADSAWSGFSRRFADIGALPKKIVQGTVEGGTIYRLNAVAPNVSAAQKICNGLKAAGESCLVVPQ
ncbi:SPOR domain-containing protein [Parasphingorhabdus cellanae]|uniref:SPOR domain-containing protein n=1 Tax=Parasphingorhabdus cellanae TaxID=2806553 RepID=A0ABX7T1V7_9SPHN|nr:SPOR domain-containing protein [Parasphingorhabdus cellanae]QTD55540.1 SPOR domain-containing protein [Parasphingorhabdus cellanae]